MPIEIRHVVYWPRKGVLLGMGMTDNVVWSKDSEALRFDNAPTFTSVEDFKGKFKMRFSEEEMEEMEREIQLREVVPTQGEFATMKDCMEALLPRWDGK